VDAPFWFWQTLAAIFGALWGSFLNVVIYRVPRGESVVSPPSHCPRCNQPIAFYDNIPIFSWLILRGRCRRCRAPFSPRYALIEALCAGLGFLLMTLYGPSFAFAYYFIFVFALVAVSFIDLDTWLIPDVISLPVMAVGLAGAWFLPGHPLLAHVLGASIGGAGLLLIAVVVEKILKKEGIGYGDVKLLAMIGAFTGVIMLHLVLLLASLQGAIVGSLWVLLRRKPPQAAPDGFVPAASAVPFGPFLSLAALEVLIFGPQLLGWIESLLG
jgi:leader peptidase (prepilin peptidase)/N-methyltransferase